MHRLLQPAVAQQQGADESRPVAPTASYAGVAGRDDATNKASTGRWTPHLRLAGRRGLCRWASGSCHSRSARSCRRSVMPGLLRCWWRRRCWGGGGRGRGCQGRGLHDEVQRHRRVRLHVLLRSYDTAGSRDGFAKPGGDMNMEDMSGHLLSIAVLFHENDHLPTSIWEAGARIVCSYRQCGIDAQVACSRAQWRSRTCARAVRRRKLSSLSTLPAYMICVAEEDHAGGQRPCGTCNGLNRTGQGRGQARGFTGACKTVQRVVAAAMHTVCSAGAGLPSYFCCRMAFSSAMVLSSGTLMLQSARWLCGFLMSSATCCCDGSILLSPRVRMNTLFTRAEACTSPYRRSNMRYGLHRCRPSRCSANRQLVSSQ